MAFPFLSKGNGLLTLSNTTSKHLFSPLSLLFSSAVRSFPLTVYSVDYSCVQASLFIFFTASNFSTLKTL